MRRSLLLALLLVIGCSKSTPSESTVEPDPASSAAGNAQRELVVDPGLLEGGRIRVEAVTKHAIDDEILASGEVVPSVDGEASMGAMVSGRIAKVLVREGDVVKKGQVLAWIDAPEAARMQGGYLQARARVWRAQGTLDRERALWKDKATSERAVQEAEAELRAAKADEAAARGLLASAHVPVPKDDARYAAARIGVSSAIAGVVSKRYAVVGGYVGLEDSLFEVIDLDKLVIRADVPEVASRRVLPDARALVLPRGVNEGCEGKVRAKLEAIDPVKRTMGVMVEVAAGCKGLVAGGFADVTLSLAASSDAKSIVVPRSAVVEIDGATAVFVEIGGDERGKFEIRNVRVGLSDGEQVVVEEGLREGEKIAVAGTFLLKGERMKAAMGGE